MAPLSGVPSRSPSWTGRICARRGERLYTKRALTGFLRAELRLEVAAALFQGLQTQLPAMDLNGELINATDDFRALRFVLFQAALQVGRMRE